MSNNGDRLEWLHLRGAILKGTVPPTALDDIVSKDYALTIRLTDGAPGRNPIEKKLTLPVIAKAKMYEHPRAPGATVEITTKPELPAALTRLPYGLTLAAQGGLPPYHWELTKLEFQEAAASVFKPIARPGSVVSDGGVVELKSSRAGLARLAVRVFDSNPDGTRGTGSAEKVLMLPIKPSELQDQVPPLQIVTPGSLPDAIEGVSYEVALSASGGMPPYRWSLEKKPSMDLGFSDPINGILKGIADAGAVGRNEFVVRVTDQQGIGQSQTRELTLNVLPGIKPLNIATTRLPAAAINQPFEAFLVAEGGQPPFKWSLASGRLPAGLNPEISGGRISGTPTEITQEPVAFAVQVSDSSGQTKTGEVSLAVIAAISPQPLDIITAKTLPPAVVGRRYDMQLTAIGGVPPYEWVRGTPWPDITAGAVTLSRNGSLSNPVFPTKKTHVLQATVRDALGNEKTEEFRVSVFEEGEIPVPPPPLEIVTSTFLPHATVGEEYRLALAAEGGQSPFEWTLKGNVPSGLRLEEGEIVWAPTDQAPESNVFTIAVHDSQNPADDATKEVTLRVNRVVRAQVPPINDPKWLWLAAIFVGSAIIKRVWAKYCYSHIEIS